MAGTTTKKTTKKTSSEDVVESQDIVSKIEEAVEVLEPVEATIVEVEEDLKPEIVSVTSNKIVNEISYKLTVDEIRPIEYNGSVLIENTGHGFVYISRDGVDFYSEAVLPFSVKKVEVDGVIYLTTKARPVVKVTFLS